LCKGADLRESPFVIKNNGLQGVKVLSGPIHFIAGIIRDMYRRLRNWHKNLLLLLVGAFFVFGCSQPTDVVEPPQTPASTATPTQLEPPPTLMPEEPTSTPSEPAVAIVNGEQISLAFFEREVERYLIAQEAQLQTDIDLAEAQQIVLDDLVNQVLLAQGAAQAGIAITDEDVQAKIDLLASEADLNAWMTTWGYTAEDLFDSLKLQMLGAAQRDVIMESVPGVVEQVEIQQIFAYTEEGAESALGDLNTGETFEDIAFTYDPVAGGYLGWTPRGYLLIPGVEEAAFGLAVGEYSEIIESDIGFHIVKILAREERQLTSDARLILQRKALQDWLANQRETSSIEVLVP
jgi:parvulin-like peptidyl-prolyl isomerase